VDSQSDSIAVRIVVGVCTRAHLKSSYQLDRFGGDMDMPSKDKSLSVLSTALGWLFEIPGRDRPHI
jgi:hypothetical protein